MRKLFTKAWLLCLLVAGAAQAQDLKAPLPKDPKVIKGTFDNGLTYYVRQNKKPENKVELRLVVKAGSMQENENQLGLAHFMEHMNFNGLANFKENELVSYLQSIGVAFGADLNAYTSFDQTVYILPIPTDKPGNLDKGFQIVQDWAHGALLTDKDIDEERGVVLEESRMGQGAQMRMLQQFFPRMLSGSRYASRLPIGKDSVLQHFKYDVLRQFHKDWYRPNLQAVIVVGDIDTATAMKYLRKHFASLKNPGNAPERTYETIAPRTTPDAMVVTDAEATNNLLAIMFPYVKKQSETSVGDYREHMVRQLAMQMLNRRYSDLAQGANPPFVFAGVEFDDMVHGYESFQAQAMFGNEGPQKALNVLMAELLRAKKFGFTESELELAKKQMLSGMERAYNERNTTESSALTEEYIRNFLENEPIPGIENEYKYYQDLLPGISLTEVNKQPAEWISNTNTFSLIMAPDDMKDKLPTSEALLAMTRAALTQEVTAGEQKAVAANLMDKTPKSGKVTKTTQQKDLGATTYTLSNGVKVTLKPTDFKSDEIIITGVRKGGTSNYGAADINNARMATDVVDAMGIGRFSPTDLSKVLAGKTVEMSLNLGEMSSGISGKSSVKDLETALQLLYLSMTAPRTDTALFNAFVTKQKQMLQFMSANPQVAYIDTTIKTLYHNSPLAPVAVPTPAMFDGISMERALEIYKKEFGTAEGFEFFIVGNVDAAKALPLIETYIGGLPVAKAKHEFKDNGLRPISGNKRMDVYKGKDKKSLILAFYHGEAAYSEDMALRAQAVAEILNIKVIEELREKLGGIYTGGYYADFSKEPYNHYNVVLQLPCGPENVEKLLTAAHEEVTTLKAKGPEQKDLDKVLAQWREQHIESAKTNDYWAGKLRDILFWGRDRQHVLQYNAWIEKLKPADVQQAARVLFPGNNEFISVLFPEKKEDKK